MKFDVTFEKWDEESVEHGDTDDRGFYWENCSLRDAVEAISGAKEYHCDRYPYNPHYVSWITADCVNDGTREYYEKGITENRSLHFPENITVSSKARIMRLFGLIK